MESRGSTQKEKIGGVTLHYTWYPGEDLYSDGDVEDELLQIAKDYGKEDYDQVIAQKKSWPVLYHFSRIRQNIISWLPLTREDTVLEGGLRRPDGRPGRAGQERDLRGTLQETQPDQRLQKSGDGER